MSSYAEKFIDLLEEVQGKEKNIPIKFVEDLQVCIAPYLQNRANGVDRFVAIKNRVRNQSSNPTDQAISTKKKFSFAPDDFSEKKPIPTIVPPVDKIIVEEKPKKEISNHDKLLDIYTGGMGKAQAQFVDVKKFIEHCKTLGIEIDSTKSKTWEAAYKVFHSATKKLLGF